MCEMKKRMEAGVTTGSGIQNTTNTEIPIQQQDTKTMLNISR